MPRFLQVVALVLVFTISGGAKWIVEFVEDDCAEKCSNKSACPEEEGCGDCSVVCSSCPRMQFFPPQVASIAPTLIGSPEVTHDAGERLPLGPPPKGVFHPPRCAG